MAVRLGFLSTYTPTQCGIATFTAALATHVHAGGDQVGVVRLVDEPQPQSWPVAFEWVTGRPGDAEHVARVLDGYDVAVIQHEYGIFGGTDGQDVLEVATRLHVPLITVLHTVLTQPTAGQHRVLDLLVEASVAVVTMTETARDRLIAGWGVDPGLVHVIAHGADDNRAAQQAAAPVTPTRRPTVLTWGLLSEGKGIEWALLALAELRERMPLPEYQVVGQTHPRVLEREGEAYRDRLLALTRDLSLSGSVHFDARYLAGPELRRVVREADVILLPYDSLEQVTSGVLTEAVAAGKPVISTRFPHAVELLAGGAGRLVPQRDATAIADALEHVLRGDGVAARMAAVSQGLAERLLWPAVAAQYSALASSVLVAATPVAATPVAG